MAHALNRPAPLAELHALGGFESGQPALDAWLQRRALANQASRASRTFVVTPEGSPEVIGFYALAAGSVAQAEAVRDLRHAMPDPVPVTILGRLAVHRAWQGQRLGSFLLRDAILRTLQVSEMIGTAALLVHAVDAEAERFYLRHGFKPSRIAPLTLMLPIKAILAATRG